ncbi:Maintenance of mitochondrial structure and function [Carpediemonas membranifera]|uniref:Maintenance of mitochondrial structure and function n=1 Tax=Carpediemonas membranifera TaxID=201153 RepID=A0A8J6B0C1_9EUKA|nr:Maintenance of mitochondrial structure and function [Carpediemonas membranifera]|eukprot:KAG9392793.1 Maintenance of mitochondrial structure and function [Carpediemonas membranifera]
MEVSVHPIVLLSIVDHYNRIASQTNKRVVGALLGEKVGNKLEVTNCYAIPYDEDPEDNQIWFLDDLFHREMLQLFHRVSSREHFIGWYSTGSSLLGHDMRIHDLFTHDASDPLYLLVDIQSGSPFLPLSAYVCRNNDGEKVFKHVNYNIGYLEAEAIGVEHLLRDILQFKHLPMAAQVEKKVSALAAFKRCMHEVLEYMNLVVEGKLPLNQQINMLIQEIFCILPNSEDKQLIAAVNERMNDFYLSLFISSLVRSVTACHRLIDNLIEYHEDGKVIEHEKPKAVVLAEGEGEVPHVGTTAESA